MPKSKGWHRPAPASQLECLALDLGYENVAALEAKSLEAMRIFNKTAKIICDKPGEAVLFLLMTACWIGKETSASPDYGKHMIDIVRDLTGR